MPYKLEGLTAYSKGSGTWKPKQRFKSPRNARRGMRLLRAVEHGWKPTRNR